MNRACVRACVLVVTMVCALAACEKAGSKGSKGSGAPSATETELLRLLPKTALGVMGTDAMAPRALLENPFMKKIQSLTGDMMGKGSDSWMSCFVDADTMRMAGAIELTGNVLTIHWIVDGLSLAAYTGCATKAGWASTLAPDGKAATVTLPGMAGATTEATYLELGPQRVYTVQRMELAAVPKIAALDRAALEANQAALQGGTAADNAALMATVAKVDRSKMMWFAGSAEGTPVAAQLGEIYGAFHMGATELTIDLTVQLKNPAMVDQATEGLRQAKASAAQLPAGVREVVQAIQLDASGDRLRGRLAVTSAQFDTMLAQMKQLSGQ